MDIAADLDLHATTEGSANTEGVEFVFRIVLIGVLDLQACIPESVVRVAG